jgi:hypothetical protein
MGGLRDDVIRVFNKQIQHLIKRSKELNQETRVSVFTFNDNVKNIVFDVDVLHSPNIEQFYLPGGQTALIDGTLQAIGDLLKVPQMYGDFGFLIYVISDGLNNINNSGASRLLTTINKLPDNFTLGFLGPDSRAVHEAKQYGFPKENIQIWNTTSQGTDEMGESMIQATDNYMIARSTGVRNTKSLFKIDSSVLTKSVIKNTLSEIPSSAYTQMTIWADGRAIKEFIEDKGFHFKKGIGYYQLTKKEKIQKNKKILVQDKSNGKLYGGQEGRDLLGLPNVEVKVAAVDHDNFKIFVQSNSVNRLLVKGTTLIVLN